jgi:hypothetical protein
VEIVHLGKHRLRWGCNGGAARDAILRRLHGYDYEKDNSDYCENDEDYFKHDCFSPVPDSAGLTVDTFLYRIWLWRVVLASLPSALKVRDAPNRLSLRNSSSS